jgi:hypothetical protein
MDDWHRKLARDLVSETPAGFVPDAAASLEIAFGHARSALTYALELARAHRIPAAGNVAGDAIWLQLGDGRVRFLLNRREGHVMVVRASQASHDETRIALADAAQADLGKMAREAIDALVADWRALPAEAKRPSAPPPDFEDEPTKG